MRKVLVTTTLIVVLFTTIVLGGGTLPLVKYLVSKLERTLSKVLKLSPSTSL